MHWFTKITGTADTTIITTVSGKEISVLCTRRANKALASRAQSLLMEIELAFACIAHKAVHFHEGPLPANAIRVNDRLALQITTRIADTCATDSATTSSGLRHFLPKWIRLDYRKGKWIGEYGF